MADIPSPLTWGTVRGNFGALNADSSDAGQAPDLDPVQGSVTLTPRLSLVKILNPLNPMIAIAKTVQCVIKDGVLLGPDGEPNVRVVATDSPGFEPSPLQWDVRIQITGATTQPAPMTINVLGGQVVDLALIVPSPPAIPVVTVVTEETKLAAVAAAAAAQASAQAALGSSIDANNSLQDALTARIDAINAKNAAQASATTATTAKDTAVSSASTAVSAKDAAATSATNAATSATAAENSAIRAEESAQSTLPLDGTTAQYLRGDTTWQTLNKSAVGLPNVDNTSDANKPVSTATNAAMIAQPAANITTGIFGVARLPIASSSIAVSGSSVSTLITPGSLRDSYENWTKSSTRKNVVIVGSSNALTGTWTTQTCTALGMVERNFAISGAAFSGDGFLTQMQAARDSVAFDNNDVGFVFITDCSNDTRANNDAGSTLDTVYTNSGPVMALAKSAFPNARVIILPIIWPATPSAQVTGVPGGYQGVWNYWVRKNMDYLRRRAMEYRCEFIEETWTWLTGHDEWMEASGGVHPNSLGYAQISLWVLKYLRGESTTSITPWETVPVSNTSYYEGILTGSSRPLRVKREGWSVVLEGTIITKVEIGVSGASDWATVPPGFRPTYGVEGTMRVNGSGVHYPIQIFPNGVVRVWHTANVPTSTYTLFTASYDIG